QAAPPPSPGGGPRRIRVRSARLGRAVRPWVGALGAVPGGRTGTVSADPAPTERRPQKLQKSLDRRAAPPLRPPIAPRPPPLRTGQTRPRREGSDRAQAPPSDADGGCSHRPPNPRSARESPSPRSQPAPRRAAPAPYSSRG